MPARTEFLAFSCGLALCSAGDVFMSIGKGFGARMRASFVCSTGACQKIKMAVSTGIHYVHHVCATRPRAAGTYFAVHSFTLMLLSSADVFCSRPGVQKILLKCS